MRKMEIGVVAFVAVFCISGQMVRQEHQEVATTKPSEEVVQSEGSSSEENRSLSSDELGAAKKVLLGYEPVRKGAAKVAVEAESL